MATILLTLAMIVAGAVAWWDASRQVPLAPSLFFVYPPDKATFVTSQTVATSAAISPDGTKLAFTARDAGGKTLLWIRQLDSLTAQPLAGTDDAAYPFWSPDSRFLAYFKQQKLMKIAATGGPPQTLCTTVAPAERGGAWNRDGTIVFSGGAEQGTQARVVSGRTTLRVHSLDQWPDRLCIPPVLAGREAFSVLCIRVGRCSRRICWVARWRRAKAPRQCR